MKQLYGCAILLLLATICHPCVVSFPRKLWQKKPGAESSLFAFERDGRVGFIDPSGNVVVAAKIPASIDHVGDFLDGLARVEDKGYIDETGTWAIKGHYWSISDFSNGLALITVEGPQKYGLSSMYIDRTGKVVSNIPASRTGPFSEGLARFEGENRRGVRRFGPKSFEYRDYPGLKGFIDRTGRVVVDPRFAEVGPFVVGISRVDWMAIVISQHRKVAGRARQLPAIQPHAAERLRMLRHRAALDSLIPPGTS